MNGATVAVHIHYAENPTHVETTSRLNISFQEAMSTSSFFFPHYFMIFFNLFFLFHGKINNSVILAILHFNTWKRPLDCDWTGSSGSSFEGDNVRHAEGEQEVVKENTTSKSASIVQIKTENNSCP